MNPREFLSLASLLVIGTPRSANLRTATSRAYYAAHHVGAEVLSGMGCTISKGGRGHGDVWERLQNSGDEELMVAGSKLANLHSNRLKADYRLNDLNAEKPENVKAHIANAQTIVQVIDRSSSSSKLPNIIKAIKDYERSIRGS